MRGFKDILTELRMEKGFSQVKLSEMLGVSKSAVAMWETGSRLPQRATIEEIADIFNVDIDYLCGRTDIRKRISFDEVGNTQINVPEYSSDMIEVVYLYGKLKTEQKEIVLNLLRSMANN